MTKKEAIIKGITDMNISLLEVLLEDNKSYMDVPKELFLEKLNIEFETLKKDGIPNFNQVVQGYCGQCNKGCGGYTFVTKKGNYLDLLFEEENKEIQDIYICSDFINVEKVKKDFSIYFSFYEEEKTAFSPTPSLQLKVKKIKEWESQFDQFKNNITNVEDFSDWYLKKERFVGTFYFFDRFEYKFLDDYYIFSYGLSSIPELVDNHHKATKALEEFKNIDLLNEEQLVKWLFTHQTNNLTYTSGYSKIKNWKQNGLIYLDKEPTVVIDCSNYKESIAFSEIYQKYEAIIVAKYSPTDEHFKKGWESKGTLMYQYLKLHDIYLDVLLEYEAYLEKLLEAEL